MKKHHWHVFWHEKLFEKHPQPHCQTRFKSDKFSDESAIGKLGPNNIS
jgi:hypothetical protein